MTDELRSRKDGIFKRIVRHFYRKSLCTVGEMESYDYLGTPIGYEIERDNLAFWTRLARRFKVKTGNKQRIAFGGYGEEYDPR